MIEASSGVGVELRLSLLPTLDGAIDALSNGIASSMAPANEHLCAWATNGVPADDPRYPILFDPQTAGGLLAALPEERVQACIQALHAAGYPRATIVGRTQTRPFGDGAASITI
jgi:selenide,water dikinase